MAAESSINARMESTETHCLRQTDSRQLDTNWILERKVPGGIAMALFRFTVLALSALNSHGVSILFHPLQAISFSSSTRNWKGFSVTMDKQLESPDKKLGLNGSSTGDQIPSGNQNSASEDSDDESIDLDEAPIPLVTEASLQDDKILVFPHQPNMVLPPNADILPFSNDEWVVVRLLKQ